MTTQALLLLALLGQIRETNLAGERLGKALKVTGRYRNEGSEAVRPEFKILVYDADHSLLASGLTVLEPREIRSGGMATMTGLILELPSNADHCEAVMVVGGDEVEPLNGRWVPLSKHAREVAKLQAAVARIPEEIQLDIFDDFFERLPEAVKPAEKLPKPRRKAFIDKAIDKLRRDLAREYHVKAADVATIVRLGIEEGWERPEDAEMPPDEPFK